MAPSFDLSACLSRVSKRHAGRTEADIQADVRDVLLYGGFDLGDEHVLLESPAPERRRIDVEVGHLNIECKKDLRSERVLEEAEQQLEGYLRSREKGTPGRYIGVLTDGALWRLYQTSIETLAFVSEFRVQSGGPDERSFRTWLGSLLATERHLEPTGEAIGERLGSGSPGFVTSMTLLRNLWGAAKPHPEVQLKRALWSKLLRTAFGTQFQDNEDLFLEHTYLVTAATLIAHLVLGFEADELSQSPQMTLSGGLFARFGIRGVGEAGFFDWVLDVEGGDFLVTDLLRRLSVFDWSEVDHDVLKELYQSVISEQTRHRLGEYYTPDWLARRIVQHTVDTPLESRVMDPACGSGTFLFHAVRHYFAAAEGAGYPVERSVGEVVDHVFGMDIHPVAISLAQVTYLLAIGAERIRSASVSLSIPVYLGDSMRWEASRETIFSPSDDIVIPTGVGALFEETTALRFPASLVSDTTRFDAFVEELAHAATDRKRGSPPKQIDRLLRQFGVTGGDVGVVTATYHQLCRLHDEERNHIWGFFVRNQARPTWFARKQNRVDVLVGNPPWLAYRYMPNEMQARFRKESEERRIWAGGRVATQQDLSSYFAARSIELYLRSGGRFGFVMPLAALSRRAYEGFRKGQFTSVNETCAVAFETPWDLDGVKPIPFPVPSCVVLGRRVDLGEFFDSDDGLRGARLVARGVLRRSAEADAGSGLTWEMVEERGPHSHYTAANSPYNERFKQGAVLVPRMLLMVEVEPAHPMQPKTMVRVRSRRGRLDKAPWKDLADQTGLVESMFLRPVYLGEHCLPFRMLDPVSSVFPYDGDLLLPEDSERISRYKGLSEWWRGNEKVWRDNRSKSSSLSLTENIDYYAKLTTQFPIAGVRVVYTKAGSNLTASVVEDDRAIIDHQLYWGIATSLDEAHYLVAILNAPALGKIVAPYQARGAFGARHFDKYVWYAPIPTFDPSDEAHAALASQGRVAQSIAHDVDLAENTGFQRLRAQLRDELENRGVLREIDELLIRVLERQGPGREPA